MSLPPVRPERRVQAGLEPRLCLRGESFTRRGKAHPTGWQGLSLVLGKYRP